MIDVSSLFAGASLVGLVTAAILIYRARSEKTANYGEAVKSIVEASTLLVAPLESRVASQGERIAVLEAQLATALEVVDDVKKERDECVRRLGTLEAAVLADRTASRAADLRPPGSDA